MVLEEGSSEVQREKEPTVVLELRGASRGTNCRPASTSLLFI
jgi:hypothetical protein